MKNDTIAKGEHSIYYGNWMIPKLYIPRIDFNYLWEGRTEDTQSRDVTQRIIYFVYNIPIPGNNDYVYGGYLNVKKYDIDVHAFDRHFESRTEPFLFEVSRDDESLNRVRDRAYMTFNHRDKDYLPAMELYPWDESEVF